MNRIEQVAAPAPAHQPQPRMPRALADVRRRAARALFQPRDATARTRRGTTGLAVAIAALAVPVLPNPAFGAVDAPHIRHHLHHNQVVPDPGAGRGTGTVTVREWEASGWTLTLPDRPAEGADPGLLGHMMVMHHHGHYVPWLAEPGRPMHAWHAPSPGLRPGTGPVVLADGSRPGSEVYRVSHSSPRVARSRAVPTPLLPSTRPANTKQMMATAGRPTSACAVPAETVSKDSHMLAHLRPTTDPMNVVVTHRGTACAAKVDYLSQARA